MNHWLGLGIGIFAVLMLVGLVAFLSESAVDWALGFIVDRWERRWSS